MHHRSRQNGFTLIELMLAMTFVSILLVSIAMLTIQISNIYTKGVTLRQVNEAGLAISNDLQRGIQASQPFDMESNEDGSAATDSYVVRQTGGRLCLGDYTYAWSNGSYLKDGASTLFNNYGSGNTTLVRLVKIADKGKTLCVADENDQYLEIPSNGGRTTELLSSGDRDLALQKFVVRGSESSGLYAVTLTIGTNDQEQLIDDTCKPPSEGNGGEDYCAVNKFDIVARAGSKEGGK